MCGPWPNSLHSAEVQTQATVFVDPVSPASLLSAPRHPLDYPLESQDLHMACALISLLFGVHASLDRPVPGSALRQALDQTPGSGHGHVQISPWIRTLRQVMDETLGQLSRNPLSVPEYVRDVHGSAVTPGHADDLDPRVDVLQLNGEVLVPGHRSNMAELPVVLLPQLVRHQLDRILG